MLHPQDAKVAAADLELPALSAILDDEAALALFAEHLPDLQPTTARCTYLRYKPHTSCLAAFTLGTNKGNQTFHLTAHQISAVEKLTKNNRTSQSHDVRGPSPLILPELAVVISPFPCDKELPSLERITTIAGRRQLISKLSSEEDKDLISAEWTPLRYKPERRFVARLDGNNQAKAVLKFHSKKVYAQSRRAAKSLGSLTGINTARPIGHSDRNQAILLRWLPGESLASFISNAHLPTDVMHEVGRLLSRLHTQQASKLPPRTAQQEAQEICRSAEDLTILLPPIKELLSEVSKKCTKQLSLLLPIAVPIHGDCHPQQFIVHQKDVAIIDLDSATLGHPASDLGNFLAHLEREVLQNQMQRSLCDQFTEELIVGYSEKTTAVNLSDIQTYLAAGLLRLAHEPFRYRQPNWPRQTEQLVERANSILKELDRQPRDFTKPENYPKAVKKISRHVEVINPFRVRRDSKLPNLSQAINPSFARQHIVSVIKQAFEDESLEIRTIRVLRHKPDRRCLIEYSCTSDIHNREVTVLGKIHSKRKHERSHRLQQALWQSDFHYESKDGISVARPVGTVSQCQMWLQESVPGIIGWDALLGPSQGAIAAQISAAAHKLHQADIITERMHTIDEEMKILEEKLPLVIRHSPELKSRINAVLSMCQELAASVPSSEPKGIHRDFYPDQIVIDRDRLFVLDHDLYCMGDPALDIGNFCGHLIEHSLRIHGHPNAYSKFQSDLCNRFVSLQNDCSLATISTYTTLTLARHIYLSTRFADRSSKTNLILDHCENLLALQEVGHQ